MWHIDIKGEGYNPDLKRRFRVRQDYHPFLDGKNRATYTVVEEWFTPTSMGDTSDFYYFTFSTEREARTFIGELVIKFNSPWQRVLLRATENLFAMSLNTACNEIDKERRERIRQQRRASSQPKTKHVYVFAMENGTVKIGVSGNISERCRAISNSSGMNIFHLCYTVAMEKSSAYSLESKCHAYFAQYRTKGEFFRVSYAQARDKLKAHSKIVEETL